MATKTRTQVFTASQSKITRTVQPNGSISDSFIVTPASTTYVDSRTGVSMPKWRSVIKSGGNATTALSGSKVRRLVNKEWNITCGYPASPQTANVAYVENVRGSNGFSCNVPNHLSTSLTAADSQAIISVLKRVQQQRTQFQGLTFLGELKETIHMLKHPFQGVRKYVSSYFSDLGKLQKGRKKSGSRSKQRKDFLDAASGAWLEVAFGIKPLISDTEELAGAIGRFVADSRRDKVSAYGEDKAGADSRNIQSPGSLARVLVSQKDVSTQSVRYVVYLDASRYTDGNSLARLQELTGFKPENFIPTVWELIPWSFLVDYFTNIGDIIAAGCTSQSDVKFVVKTTRRETVRSLNFIPYLVESALTVPGVYQGGVTIGVALLTRADISRTSQANVGLPSFSIDLPGRPQQYANMFALWGSSERTLTNRFRF